MTGTAIDVRGLAKTYPNGRRVLQGLSFAVHRGEIFGLIGENGAGKSTLIKIIATLLTPSAGSVRVLGLDGLHSGVHVRRRLGVATQDCNLDNRLTVRQNLWFHGRYFGLDRRGAKQAADAWLETLDLTRHAAEKVHRLSGGTKRRAMLARAFMTEPELLVLDEPTSGLDPDVREVVWKTIHAFRQQGHTVFLSTHHFDEARALCDRFLLLREGRGQVLASLPDAVSCADRKKAFPDSPVSGA